MRLLTALGLVSLILLSACGKEPNPKADFDKPGHEEFNPGTPTEKNK